MTFFILGSHPALSLAEIASVLGAEKKYSKHSKEILLLDDTDISPEELQDRLGGTIKIGDVVGEVTKIDRDEIAELLITLLSDSNGKVTFGISTYSLDVRRDLSSEVKQIGMTIKKRLKENGQSSRFVATNSAALPSVAVTGEKLLENGAEFVFIVSKEKIYIGQTRTVQDFQSWSARDYGRPRRDAKSGMLPPKLARMMINLATSPLTPPPWGGGILDPFCGSGTVLMEAALMGFTNLIGSDISEKAVKDTKINLEWLTQNEGVETATIRLFNKSIETLAGELKEKVDAIVGETYLGPPLSGQETPNRQKQITNEVTEHAYSTLGVLKQLLKNNGTAVLAFPAFCAEKNIQYLPTKQLAEAVGLKILPFTGEPNEISPSGGLLYVRENQLVGREIVKILKA